MAGLECHYQGRFNEAETIYRQCLQRNRADVTALNLLGIMAAQSGHYTEACKIFNHVLRTGNNNASTYVHLAYTHWQLEDWQNAEKALNQAQRIDPDLYQLRKIVELIDWERRHRAARADGLLKVTAVITCYESADTLGLTVMSLVNQTEKPYEIIVTDDGSSEETCSYIKNVLDSIKHHGIRTQFITHPRTAPYRLNTIRNNAIHHATGDLIFITDGDTIIPKEIIARHRQIHAKSAKPLFLACLRKDLHGDGKLGNLSDWWESYVNNTENKSWEEIDLQPTYATATGSYRKELCEKVGAYNEAFNGNWGFDDTEFGFRLKTLGGARVSVNGTICHIPHETSLGSRDAIINRDLFIRSQLSVFKEIFLY